jgi:hypothetical protein
VWTDKEGEYDGQWQGDKMHGKALYTATNGDTYDGQFKHGKKHGKGVYTSSASGGKYDGEWKDGKQHGKGVDIFADGEQSEGEWKDGERLAEAAEQTQTAAKDKTKDAIAKKQKALLDKLSVEQETDEKQLLVLAEHKEEAVTQEDYDEAKRLKGLIGTLKAKVHAHNTARSAINTDAEAELERASASKQSERSEL